MEIRKKDTYSQNKRWKTTDELRLLYYRISKKKINLLDNEVTQPSKFRTQNWVKITDEECGMYNTNSQNKLNTTISKSSPCDKSDTYILLNGAIAITGAKADAEVIEADKRNKQVIFKRFASFTYFKSETKNILVNNAKDLDVVMEIYNLLEYSNNYSTRPSTLW